VTERTIDLTVSLTLERDGARFDVWTEEGAVVVNAPSLSSLRSLRSLRSVPVGSVGTDVRVRELTADIPVEVRVRHATVARVGDGRGSALGRRLTGVEARLDWRGVVAAAVRALS